MLADAILLNPSCIARPIAAMHFGCVFHFDRCTEHIGSVPCQIIGSIQASANL